MGYRRGFKSECEQLAHDTRRELKLDLKSPLAVTDLAEHLCIPVLATSDLVKFGATPEDIRRAERILSAFTVVVGTYKAIFYNPSHPTSRLANSLAHELSHILLEHVPTVAVVDRRRVWNADQEAEADWLAGALLVPREGAVRWLKAGGSLAQGGAHFRVSDALFTWRVNNTGITRQLRLTA